MGWDAKLLRFAKAQAGAAVAFPLGLLGTAISLRAEVGALLPWGARLCLAAHLHQR